MNLEFIPAWANAIAQFEGYNSPGSRPARNHNPGDLKFAGQAGAVGRDSGGFAIFPDDVTGFQALYRQLEKYVNDFPGYSILEIMAHYLGQPMPTVNAQGDAFTYAAHVASSLGADISTTLGQLASGSPGGMPLPAVPTGMPTGTIDASVIDSSMIEQGIQAAGLTTGEILGGLAVLGLLAYLAWS